MRGMFWSRNHVLNYDKALPEGKLTSELHYRTKANGFVRKRERIAESFCFAEV